MIGGTSGETIVTEMEWMDCTDPQEMLEFLQGKVSQRRLRLFAVACCRRISHHLTDERSKQAIDISERFADGLATKEELTRAWHAASSASYDRRRLAEWAGSPDWYYAGKFDYAAHLAAALNLNPIAALSWANGEKGNTDRWEESRREQFLLLRDVFGNPFRLVSIDPTWLSSDAGLLVSMAQKMYDSREFADMPVLADALEKAGCTNQEILDHCRSGGEHVRGCWVIDALLGKR